MTDKHIESVIVGKKTRFAQVSFLIAVNFPSHDSARLIWSEASKDSRTNPSNAVRCHGHPQQLFNWQL